MIRRFWVPAILSAEVSKPDGEPKKITLLGEELFAASAYLSREPTLLGSIKAQDITKAILLIIMALGIVLLMFGLDVIRPLLRAQ